MQERALACNLAVIRGPLAVLFTWWSVRQRSAAESGAAAETITRRPWSVARGALAAGRGLVAPVFGCSQPNKARRPRAVACG